MLENHQYLESILRAQIASLEQERDLYKPYYNAIQRIILQHAQEIVTAILRAAKPYLDVNPGDQLCGTNYSFGLTPTAIDYLNSRIRYAVAIEPTHEEIEALARRLRRELRGCDDWDSCDVLESARNDWRAVARAAWAHLKGGK